MKALSVHQPYAAYIGQGKKTLEIRSKKTNYRGELVICSTKKMTCSYFPAGVTVCLVNLIDCFSFEKTMIKKAMIPSFLEGMFAWRLELIYHLPGLQVTGKQGIFNLDKNTEKCIKDFIDLYI